MFSRVTKGVAKCLDDAGRNPEPLLGATWDLRELILHGSRGSADVFPSD